MCKNFIRGNTCERERGGSQGEPSDRWKLKAVKEVGRGWWKCPRPLYSLRRIWQGCWECSNQNCLGVLLGRSLPYDLCCIQSLAGSAHGKLGLWCKCGGRFQSMAAPGALGKFCSLYLVTAVSKWAFSIISAFHQFQGLEEDYKRGDFMRRILHCC